MSFDPTRRSVRTETALEIVIQAKAAAIRARIADLSEGGAFIDTPHPFYEGVKFAFSFQLPDRDEPISGHAKVVWRQLNVGMGIRFEDLSDEDREQIKFYVAALFFKMPPESGE